MFLLLMQDQYAEAKSKLEEAMEEFREIEDRLGAAWCLEHLGQVFLGMNNKEDAERHLQAAKDLFLSIGFAEDVSRCQGLLDGM